MNAKATEPRHGTASASGKRPGREGMALFAVMVILATLGLIGGTVYTVVSTNIGIGGNFLRQQESLHQAEAGVHYVAFRANAAIEAGTLTLGAQNVAVNYVAPSGYSFDPVTNLTQLAEKHIYLVTVTGRSGSARTTLEAVLGRRNLLGGIGLFGDQDVQVQPGFDIYSYDSDTVLNPTPADSTNEACIGSNITVDMQPGTLVDGVVMLGESTLGAPATYSGPGSQPLSRTDRVDPDPLGAVGGPLENLFTYYSNPVNNNNAAAGLSGNTLRVNPNQTLTLDPGTYYLTDYYLGSNATNLFNSTPANPVVIYLDGELRTQPTSGMVTSSGSPRSVYIFSRQSDPIQLQPKGALYAFVYAPYAPLQVQPNNDAYGIFWSQTTTLQPNGDIYLDMGAIKDFVARNLVVMSTKESR